LIEDIILPPQEAGGADVEIGGAESDIWLLKNHLDKVDKIVGHCHSHNSMGASFSGGSDSGDRLNHKKLMESRNNLLFIVVAQPKKENDYFEYEASYGFKYPSPLGTPFYIEIPAVVKIETSEENKELTKLRNFRIKVREQLKLVDEKIMEIIKVDREKIKEQAEKIIKEQVKSHSYASNSIEVNYRGRQFDLNDYGSYGGYGLNKPHNDLWVYEGEDLTEEEIESIKAVIKGSNEYKYLIDVIKTDDYFKTGEKLYSLYIPCGKKKILAGITELIENIVYGVENKHEN
jgi:hypothetical protein